MDLAFALLVSIRCSVGCECLNCQKMCDLSSLHWGHNLLLLSTLFVQFSALYWCCTNTNCRAFNAVQTTLCIYFALYFPLPMSYNPYSSFTVTTVTHFFFVQQFKQLFKVNKLFLIVAPLLQCFREVWDEIRFFKILLCKIIQNISECCRTVCCKLLLNQPVTCWWSAQRHTAACRLN